MSVGISVEVQQASTVERATRPVPSFPGTELVQAAAALFATERVAERRVAVGYQLGDSAADEGAWWQVLGPVTDSTRSVLQGEDFRDYAARVAPEGQGPSPIIRHWTPTGTVSELVEGPRWYVEVSPGVVSVRSTDPVRRERTIQRQAEDRAGRVAELAANLVRDPEYVLPDPAPQRTITSWSPKSRSMMVKRMGQLDYAPLLGQDGELALVTFTYPGEWLTVAPDSATCHAHLRAYRWRFERHYKRKLIAVWKREFQRRGAPHYHLLVTAPPDTNGETFREWTARTWADIVDHPDAEQKRRHRLAGTGVDFTEGKRFLDPKRAGIYFSKHGSFAAKDYQNDAPAEWEGSSVGRFWGYWGLEPAVSTVEVAPDVARAVVRTARRFSDSSKARVQVYRWRKVTTVDRETGELGFKWRKRRTTVPVRRLRQGAGYLVVNDAPVLAGQLARASAIETGIRPRTTRTGWGPAGYLP